MLLLRLLALGSARFRRPRRSRCAGGDPLGSNRGPRGRRAKDDTGRDGTRTQIKTRPAWVANAKPIQFFRFLLLEKRMRLRDQLAFILTAFSLLPPLPADAQTQSQVPSGSGSVVQPQSQTLGPDAVELSKLRSDLQRAQQLLKDWPALARYHDADAQLSPLAPGENRVVFLGDSITDNWGRKYGKFFPGKSYVNRGISGQTTPQMLIRFRRDVIALKPKAVVILAGTNDIAGNTGPTTLEAIEDNLMSMAELAKANRLRVVLASVLPVCDYFKPQTQRRPPEKIEALNIWLKNYAAKNRFVYLDYYSAMIDEEKMLRQELTYDGLHPNDAGYEIMAPLAEKAISLALAARNPATGAASGSLGR
jgi:lysophospholipase L1-like esterase